MHEIDKEEVLAVLSKSADLFGPLVDGYLKNKHKFETEKNIRMSSHKYMMGLKNKGNHRKLFGKKMCAKLNNDVHVEYLKDKRTFVVRHIEVSKRWLSIEHVTINHYSSPKGIIYMLKGVSGKGVREDVAYDNYDLFFFTSHFFDRLAERGYGSDPFSRANTVKTFLIDFAIAQMGLGFSLFNPAKGTTKIYLGHGVAAGESVMLKDNALIDAVVSEEDEKPSSIQLHMLLTYLTPEMVHPDLWYVMNKRMPYLRHHQNEILSVMEHI